MFHDGNVDLIHVSLYNAYTHVKKKTVIVPRYGFRRSCKKQFYFIGNSFYKKEGKISIID